MFQAAILPILIASSLHSFVQTEFQSQSSVATNGSVTLLASSPNSGRAAPGPDHGPDPHNENHGGPNYIPDPYNYSTGNGSNPYADPHGSDPYHGTAPGAPWPKDPYGGTVPD